MKVCGKCGIEKSEAQFTLHKKEKDGLNCWCRACSREASIQYHNNRFAIVKRRSVKQNRRQRIENNSFILEYLKTRSCVDCGLKDVRVLEFHHKNPMDKKYSIGRMRDKSRELIEQEINKCDVVCANCHRIRHLNEEREVIGENT